METVDNNIIYTKTQMQYNEPDTLKMRYLIENSNSLTITCVTLDRIFSNLGPQILYQWNEVTSYIIEVL